MVKVTEAQARQACRNDGVDPDLLIAGKPAWKSYRQQPEAKVEADEMPPEAAELFEPVQTRMVNLQLIRAEARRDGEKLSKLLKGKVVKSHKGEMYQITYVTDNWDGGFSARGRKLLAAGGLGSQVWDIGSIGAGSFKDGR